MQPRKLSSLSRLYAAALAAMKAKKNFCETMSRENNPCWWELNPYEDLVTLIERLSENEYIEIMSRSEAPKTYIELNDEQAAAYNDLRVALERCEQLGISSPVKKQ